MSVLLNRRDVVRGVIASGAALSFVGCASAAQSTQPPRDTAAIAYPYTLPPLPYAFDALEPHVDALTMQIHHDAHHAAYVKNLNEALAKHDELQRRPLNDLLAHLDGVPDDVRTSIRNNGGGFVNHSLFWTIMSPDGGGEPGGSLLPAINASFGSFDALKTQLNQAAAGVFGSGWAWLVVHDDGRLGIESFPNQDTPVMRGLAPVLGIDVWEHAYYLQHQNRRAEWLDAFWRVVNWQQCDENYRSARLTQR